MYVLCAGTCTSTRGRQLGNTRDISPLRAWCCARVADGGLTSKMAWVNVLCLLGVGWKTWYTRSDAGSLLSQLDSFLVFEQSQGPYAPRGVEMVHEWAEPRRVIIDQWLGQHLSHLISKPSRLPSKHMTLRQYWFNVVSAINRYRFNVSCFLGRNMVSGGHRDTRN